MDRRRADRRLDREMDICSGVQRAVEARLKAPGTADFPGCIMHQSQVQYAGGGHYNFSSYVDAQNSFGAKIRTYYSGEAVVDKTGNWIVTQFEMH
jgi:hypothetical protein